ncbi:type 1 fimbrial protein [Salmonella enterica]|nr:type 1 fimbrial protein [Salmonella enterica]ELW6563315.1 type 1 fimbrial protein [Salmonella enterica]ELZ1404534.1 type 1 fimbrial protein [Salmonella enterica]
MKHAEKTGMHQTGKAGMSRRRHLPRLSVISGLVLTASLLSAGISEQASAVTLTFDYTYTIEANTCNFSAQGTAKDGPLTGSSATLSVDWGTVTKSQLNSSNKDSITKTFGLEMNCGGDIYQPTLTVTANNVNTPDLSGTFYVADPPDSVAGFAVQVKQNGGVTPGDSLRSGEVANLDEHVFGNNRTITLEAWPIIMSGKSVRDLISGNPISGTVIINVRYN